MRGSGAGGAATAAGLGGSGGGVGAACVGGFGGSGGVGTGGGVGSTPSDGKPLVNSAASVLGEYFAAGGLTAGGSVAVAIILSAFGFKTVFEWVKRC